MNNKRKYIILYILFVLSIFAMYYPIDIFSKKSVELQEQILLKQAQTHFSDQVSTRKWNASYGGLYAKPKYGQNPNQYLKDNTITTIDNQTLIKINPAWMTRQLSEASVAKEFHFRITSLIPINPNNKATPFEERALKYFESSNKKEYYELNQNKTFNYMGALITAKECLKCHEQQGYKIGDIRGGISISLDTSEFEIVTSSIKERALITKIFVLFFLVSITLLIHKQLKNNELLTNEVIKRTKEIESTKQLLQKILDSELSFLLLSDSTNVIYTNKTLLDFFGFDSLEEFKKNYSHISDTFEDAEDEENYLQHFVNGVHWIDYLKLQQHKKDLKVIIKKDGANRYFKPHLKEITIEDKKLCLIIFDEITKELEKIQELKDEASKDTLTKLFNRGKFNDVLSKEISLSNTAKSPLSIIFADIDHFKKVNDTLGHDVGDEVLIELANIITSSVRDGDFVARWGGEEFIITLQSTNKSQASKLAEKIRQYVEEHTFKNAGKLTVSLGVTQYLEDEEEHDFTKRVDDALYEAKESGRNKVIVY